MNKRTLLVALVLLSVACAYASTVTIIYPAPVEGLDSHLANTTTAHDTAATKASLATLSADVLTRANINGSTTQDFSAATIQWSNASAGALVTAWQNAASGSIATGAYVQWTTMTEGYDSGSEFSTGVFTAKAAGLYLVNIANCSFYGPFDDTTAGAVDVTCYLQRDSETLVPFARSDIGAKAAAPTTRVSVNGMTFTSLTAGQTIKIWFAVDAPGSASLVTLDGFTDKRSGLQIIKIR
jgi:hypothetical protein